MDETTTSILPPLPKSANAVLQPLRLRLRGELESQE
jgi:hypothetical protein